MHGLPHVVVVALLVTGVSGCGLLDLLLGDPFAFDPDEFPFPSPGTTFTSGTATIELQDETLVLDQLADGTVQSDLGIHVTWTNGEGWYLTFTGFPDAAFMPDNGYLSMDRIFDGQHWLLYDQSRCVTTTDQADAAGVVGSAVCRGLEWSDYFSAFSGFGLPEEIPGEPPFDAEITFEAH